MVVRQRFGRRRCDSGAGRVALRGRSAGVLAGAGAPRLRAGRRPATVAPTSRSRLAPVQVRPAQSLAAQARLSRSDRARSSATSSIWQRKARSQGVREATIQAVIPTLSSILGSSQLDRSQRRTPTSRQRCAAVVRQLSATARHDVPDPPRPGALFLALGSNLYADPAALRRRSGRRHRHLRQGDQLRPVTGGFDLLEVLASLAYEGRRRALFEDEFVAALKLLDIGVPR